MDFTIVAGIHNVTPVNVTLRVTILGDSYSTRATLRKLVTRPESRFSQNDSTRVTINDWRLESESFYKISEFLMDNPVRLHTKKWAFFASVMVKTGANFLFWLSTDAMLYFKDQVSPSCTEVDLRFCFHGAISRTEFIDILSQFIVVFAYCDHGNGPHTVTLSLYHIPVKWFKFFRFIAHPEIRLYCKI